MTQKKILTIIGSTFKPSLFKKILMIEICVECQFLEYIPVCLCVFVQKAETENTGSIAVVHIKMS